jgi:hypothetical protein
VKRFGDLAIACLFASRRKRGSALDHNQPLAVMASMGTPASSGPMARGRATHEHAPRGMPAGPLPHRDIALGGGLGMRSSKADERRPLAYCEPCSERTPHRYERIGVDGQLASRAICLICKNDSRRDAVREMLTGPSSWDRSDPEKPDADSIRRLD